METRKQSSPLFMGIFTAMMLTLLLVLGNGITAEAKVYDVETIENGTFLDIGDEIKSTKYRIYLAVEYPEVGTLDCTAGISNSLVITGSFTGHYGYENYRTVWAHRWKVVNPEKDFHDPDLWNVTLAPVVTTYNFDELKVGQIIYAGDVISSSDNFVFSVFKNGQQEYGRKGLTEYTVEYSYEGLKTGTVEAPYGWEVKEVTPWHVNVAPVEPVVTSNTVTIQTAAPHTHDMEWATVQEATMERDGIEAYRCKTCGYIEEQLTISAATVYVKELYAAVDKAAANGKVTFDSGFYHTISDPMLEKLSKRNDVTVKVNFTISGQKYSITFPAGCDYSELLSDKEKYYGFFGLNGYNGITVEKR